MVNTSKIHFAIENAPLIRRYCDSLFRHTSLHFFTFHRVFKTGVMASLTTNPTWLKHFLYQGGSRHMEARLKEGMHLWSSLGADLSRMAIEADIMFNVAYPVDIVFEHANFFDVFNFATFTDNDVILESYLNQRTNLDNFCFYFYSVAKSLIESAMSERYLFCLESFNRNALSPSFNADLPGFFIQDFSLPQFSLSLREIQTAILFLRGRSWSEIADELGIQQSTARSYYHEVKQKLGVTTRTEFFDRAYEMGLHKLPIESLFKTRPLT